MDNSYFIFSEKEQTIVIERFHICTWEFKDNTSLIEFGCEINSTCLIEKDTLKLIFFIPWLTEGCNVEDFYFKLNDSNNSRFIFNDSINKIHSFDGGSNLKGVVYQFSDRNELCVLPITFSPKNINKEITICIDLKRYQSFICNNKNPPNVYLRFAIAPKSAQLSTIKNGITRSTILYDIKINEKRNLVKSLIDKIDNYRYCEIETCFCFNIIPNSYDLIFLDNSTLQSVRTLEYSSFKSYLGDDRIKKDDLMVVFNKKNKGKPFSFFTIYAKERIGAGQLAIALLINFICGIFLFIPSFRKTFTPEMKLINVWNHLPLEIYIGLIIVFSTITVFMRYYLISTFKYSKNWIFGKS